MTLTPLAPLQGPQPQQPGELPNIPPPMQPGTGPSTQIQGAAAPQQPWHTDVTQNFQQAYNTFTPLAVGLSTGAIPIHTAYPLGVIPQGSDQQVDGGGNTYIPGPNSTQYNGGQPSDTSETVQSYPGNGGSTPTTGSSGSSTSVPDYFGTGGSGENSGGVTYTPPFTGGATPGGVSTSGYFLPPTSGQVGQTTAAPGLGTIPGSDPRTPLTSNDAPIPSLWNPDGTPYQPPEDPVSIPQSDTGVWTGGGDSGGGD